MSILQHLSYHGCLAPALHTLFASTLPPTSDQLALETACGVGSKDAEHAAGGNGRDGDTDGRDDPIFASEFAAYITSLKSLTIDGPEKGNKL